MLGGAGELTVLESDKEQTMTDRPSIPLPTERAVLIKSRHRCCLCFWLEGIDEVQRGQIAHLDHDRTNNNEDNLCFLCTKEHHDDYDSARSQSKRLQIGEVKHYRNELYKEMELRFYALEVERKLRLMKQEIRKIAHAGLILRAQEKPTHDEALKWQDEAVILVKRIAGVPAEFDFIHCTEGVGKIDLQRTEDVRRYLSVHANYLKELARTMDATDLIEIEAEPGA